jgi:hypothetical protein
MGMGLVLNHVMSIIWVDRRHDVLRLLLLEPAGCYHVTVDKYHANSGPDGLIGPFVKTHGSLTNGGPNGLIRPFIQIHGFSFPGKAQRIETSYHVRTNAPSKTFAGTGVEPTAWMLAYGSYTTSWMQV